MDYTISVKTYLSDILTAYRVNELIMDDHQPDYGILDFHYRKHLFSNFDYYQFYKDLTVMALPGQPIEYHDAFGLLYIVFVEPEALSSYHILGPYLYELPFCMDDEADFMAFAHKRQIPADSFRQVRAFFQRIPLIKDMLVWKSLLNTAMNHYHNMSVTIRTVSFQDTPDTMQTNSDHYIPHSTLDYATLEARYEIEHKMLEAIKSGNVKKALSYHNQFMGFALDERGSDALSSAKWYIIAANTIFRKAVEDAKVHPLYIDQLSGKFVMDIQAATSLVQLNNINTTMIRKYCMLVQTYSREEYSLLIRDCLNYIDFHYQEKLSLLFFAKKYAVSKNYLSTLFHKEVKQTMTDYINSTRVRQAILLLNTTDLSMQEIADKCGFTDANYFTRTFKKFQGMTPLKYRLSLINGH